MISFLNIIFAGIIFVVAWNSRKFQHSAYFDFIGTAYFFTANLLFFSISRNQGIGLFGLQFLVYWLQLKTSLIAGAISLSFMTLPWIIRTAEEAIKVVPDQYREASLALGATKWQTIIKVVIPAALPGILTGILLGMGKAMGETAVVWLTAGSGLEAFVPRTVYSPTGSLPMYIYLLATQGHTAEGLTNAFGASLILLTMFLTLSVGALVIRNYYLKRLGK